jgi:hypothetical protein
MINMIYIRSPICWKCRLLYRWRQTGRLVRKSQDMSLWSHCRRNHCKRKDC